MEIFRHGILIEVEGVRVTDGEVVMFDDWLVAQGHPTQQSMRDKRLSEGDDEDDVTADIDALEEEFYAWCDAWDLEGITC